MLRAVIKITPYMRIRGEKGVTLYRGFDVRMDGSVMARSGKPSNSQSCIGKFAKLGREPKCLGTSNRDPKKKRLWCRLEVAAEESAATVTLIKDHKL